MNSKSNQTINFFENLIHKSLSIFLLNGICLKGKFIRIEKLYSQIFIIIKGFGKNNSIQVINFDQITSLIPDSPVANSDNTEDELNYDEKLFILQAQEKEQEISIFFINGIRINGFIKSIDLFSEMIILTFYGTDLKTQVINLKNISSIVFQKNQ